MVSRWGAAVVSHYANSIQNIPNSGVRAIYRSNIEILGTIVSVRGN